MQSYAGAAKMAMITHLALPLGSLRDAGGPLEHAHVLVWLVFVQGFSSVIQILVVNSPVATAVAVHVCLMTIPEIRNRKASALLVLD